MVLWKNVKIDKLGAIRVGHCHGIEKRFGKIEEIEKIWLKIQILVMAVEEWMDDVIRLIDRIMEATELDRNEDEIVSTEDYYGEP